MENNFRIGEVKAREILDCRGDPTIEVDVITEGGFLGRADTPAGRSRGRYEAFEFRDGGERYGGLGVRKAVGMVNEVIANLIKGYDVRHQREIDYAMIEKDGTSDKSKLEEMLWSQHLGQ